MGCEGCLRQAPLDEVFTFEWNAKDELATPFQVGTGLRILVTGQP